MRNDNKGRVIVDSTLRIETFYASGARGKEVRADGTGGLLPRGYYAKAPATGLVGPVSCRKGAVLAQFLIRRNG